MLKAMYLKKRRPLIFMFYFYDSVGKKLENGITNSITLIPS